jgi:hypothetical protein
MITQNKNVSSVGKSQKQIEYVGWVLTQHQRLGNTKQN